MPELYLSRLLFNYTDARTFQENPYLLHQELWKAFGDRGGDRPFLYRPEHTSKGYTCLVQSVVKPDWSLLHVELKNSSTKTFAPPIEAGRRLRFRLRANPVKREKAGGKRVALKKHEDLKAWIERKGQAGGFALLRALPLDTDVVKAMKSDRKTTHQSVTFEGVLKIQDAQKFEKCLIDGIGPAKAFGFGLLSLAPAPE